jgi:hypothetical protein
MKRIFQVILLGICLLTIVPLSPVIAANPAATANTIASEAISAAKLNSGISTASINKVQAKLNNIETQVKGLYTPIAKFAGKNTLVFIVIVLLVLWLLRGTIKKILGLLLLLCIVIVVFTHFPSITHWLTSIIQQIGRLKQ